MQQSIDSLLDDPFALSLQATTFVVVDLETTGGSPEGGGMSDLEAVPNPAIHACQILDPGHGVARIAILSEVLKQGRQMGYSRSRIVDADQPSR